MANELHTMPFKCERFFSSQSVRRMKWDERGVYALLLADAWMTGGRLPADAEEIRKMLGIDSDSAWNRIKNAVILEKFPISPCGGYRENPAQKDLYLETVKISKTRSKAGAMGGRPASVLLKQTESKTESKMEAKKSIQNQNQSQISPPVSPAGGLSEICFQQLSDTASTITTAGGCERPDEPKKRKPNKFRDRIEWDSEAMDYRPIPEDIVSDWRMAYPACNIGLEVNRAAHWLRANPARHKQDHYLYLTRWLARTQRNGGTR
jgi:uncharacterized protein YdaU (DUF1376 family)